MSDWWLRFDGLWKASGDSPEPKMYRKFVFLTLWNEISWPLGNFGPSGQLRENCQVPELSRKSFSIDSGSIWPSRSPQGSSCQKILVSFTIPKNLARDIADCLRLPMAGPKRLAVFAKNINLVMIETYCHQ